MRYPGAIWQPSLNFNHGLTPQFITIHHTDGQPNVKRSVDELCNPEHEKSAHFVIGQAGEVYQLVDTVDKAWHAKGWNSQSIGIEHVARTPGEFKHWHTLSLPLRQKLLPASMQVDVEHDPGFPLTEVQLAASARLVAWLCKAHCWPADREHIRPHCECPGTTHLDCGKDIAVGGIWPWSQYLELINAEMAE